MPTATSKAAEAAARSILDVVPRRNRWAESSVSHASGDVRLSLRQLSALTMIESEVTTLGDVARRLMVTPAVVTGLIDRLERRGYVRRVSSTDDRRRVLLALTDKGEAAASSVERHLSLELEQSLSNLSAEDLRMLDKALQTLKPVAASLEVSASGRASR